MKTSSNENASYFSLFMMRSQEIPVVPRIDPLLTHFTPFFFVCGYTAVPDPLRTDVERLNHFFYGRESNRYGDVTLPGRVCVDTWGF